MLVEPLTATKEATLRLQEAIKAEIEDTLQAKHLPNINVDHVIIKSGNLGGVILSGKGITPVIRTTLPPILSAVLSKHFGDGPIFTPQMNDPAKLHLDVRAPRKSTAAIAGGEPTRPPNHHR